MGFECVCLCFLQLRALTLIDVFSCFVIFEKVCSKGVICEVLRRNACHSPNLLQIHWLYNVFCILGRASCAPWPFTLHSSGNSCFHIKPNVILCASLAEGKRFFKTHWKHCVVFILLIECVWALLMQSCCLAPQLWVSPERKNRFVGLRV